MNAFIDCEKPFDFVDAAVVLEALKDQGIDLYIRLLENMYKGCMGGRIILHEKSEKFPIRKGVRGGTILPKLFTACLKGLFRKLNWQKAGLLIKWRIFGPLQVRG